MLLFGASFIFQSVEERCVYKINPENGSWTEIKREAWISSNVYGLTRAIQVSRVQSSRILPHRRLEARLSLSVIQ